MIAETRGGDPNKVVVVGAHLDSVGPGPGINDNGSGSAALVEFAQKLRGVYPKNKIRFIWFSAEESGLLGSEAYVASLPETERAKIAAMLNFDMIGSPNFVHMIYDGDLSDSPPIPEDVFAPAARPFSATIEKIFLDYFKANRIPNRPTDFDGRSDYGPFIANGIPAGGLFTGAEGIKTPEEAALFGGVAGEQYDGCYHLGCDDFFNLSNKALDVNSDAAAHALITIAQSKIPDRPATPPSVQRRARRGQARTFRTRRRWRRRPNRLRRMRTVLITGCSTGIGRATALRLARGGWKVFATARQPATLDELAAAGCETLALDVTNEDSMQAALAEVAGGWTRSSTTPATRCRARSRRCRWTRSAASSRPTCSGCCASPNSCCPECARRGTGTIVNVSSMGGKLTFPGGGAYHATKYAVEAISDALRMEVGRFGIDVVCVEPGLIRTEFGATAAGGVDESGPYAEFNAAVAKSTRDVYSGPLSRLGGDADSVAKAIEKALAKPAPAGAGDGVGAVLHRPAPRAPRPRVGQGRRRVVQVNADDFVSAQDRVWPAVLDELRAGRKTSHWMWFVFPQLAGPGPQPDVTALRAGGRRRGARVLRAPRPRPAPARVLRALAHAHRPHRLRHLRRHRRAQAALLDDPLRRRHRRPALPAGPRCL